MSTKPVLEVVDTSLSPEIRDKLVKVISPIFEVTKSVTEEFYLSVNSDFREILRRPQSNILDFAITEFGWKDIYDVNIFSMIVRKKYDIAMKTSLIDVIKADTNYFYQHYIVIKTSPGSNQFIAITGKRLKDVLEMKDGIDNKIASLEKTLEEKERVSTEIQNKKFDKVRFELDNIAVNTRELKDKVTKELEETFRQIASIKNNHSEELLKIQNQLLDINSSFTTTLASSNNELKMSCESKINTLNEKLVEMIANVNHTQNEYQKAVDTIRATSEQKFGALQNNLDEQSNTQKTQKAELDAKFSELKVVSDTRFHTLKTETDLKLAEFKSMQIELRNEQTSKYEELKQELKSGFAHVSSEFIRQNDLTSKLDSIRAEFAETTNKLKGYITVLDSNVHDLEMKVFPTGKDMIRQ